MPDTTRKKPPQKHLSQTQFWGLVLVLFFSMQVPVVRTPIRFLSTWIHELGHGFGAIIAGGQFESLQVSPDFSGLAYTYTSGVFGRFMTLSMGLLGPAIMGVILLFLSRGLNWNRTAILLLTVLLGLSQIWAADMFTRALLGALFFVFGLCAWKLSEGPILYLAQVTAIVIALNVPSDFGYFFVGGGMSAGQMYRSDTGQLADLLGGPHWFWGTVMAALSIVFLLVGVLASDRWARKRGSA